MLLVLRNDLCGTLHFAGRHRLIRQGQAMISLSWNSICPHAVGVRGFVGSDLRVRKIRTLEACGQIGEIVADTEVVQFSV